MNCSHDTDKNSYINICIQPLWAGKYQRKTLIEIEFGNMIIQRFVHTNELTNAGTEQTVKDKILEASTPVVSWHWFSWIIMIMLFIDNNIL